MLCPKKIHVRHKAFNHCHFAIHAYLFFETYSSILRNMLIYSSKHAYLFFETCSSILKTTVQFLKTTLWFL